MKGHQYNTEPTCIKCKLPAGKIQQVVHDAAMHNMEPGTFIRAHEGTYDMFKPNKFYCDRCYITAGMPNHNGKRQF